MRIFVYEHVTGGGLAGAALPASLAREGDLMLQTLLRDLGAVAGVELVAARDPRLPPLPEPVAQLAPRAGEGWLDLFRRGLEDADAAWPIAPETDGILEILSQTVVDEKVLLLSSRPEAVRVAASKRATARALRRVGVAAAEAFAPGDFLPPGTMAWVAKPDEGAGCEDTRLFWDANDAVEWVAGRSERFILTPFIAGSALSLSLLCRKGECCVLACNQQRIVLRDDRFCFLGASVGAVPTRPEFTALARRIAAALPGLWGYVGVDLVWDGRRAVVMDINPRLTTSYAALHTALDANPAALVLDLLDRRKPLPPHFDPPHAVDVDLELSDAA